MEKKLIGNVLLKNKWLGIEINLKCFVKKTNYWKLKQEMGKKLIGNVLLKNKIMYAMLIKRGNGKL